MTFPTVWTAERKALLKDLWAKGYSSSRCAALLSGADATLSAAGVRAYVSKMGLTGTDRVVNPDDPDLRTVSPTAFWTAERVETLKRLYADGLSGRDIAIQMGAPSRNAAIGKIARLGLTRTVRRMQAVQPGPRRPPAARPKAPPAQVRVTGNGRQSYASAPDQPFEPLHTIADVSHARPWITRIDGECKYPVSGDGADVFSCCAPVERVGYCQAHADLCFYPPKTTGKEYARSLRRFTGKAA